MSHRIQQDAGDLIRDLQRRLSALERRRGVTNIEQHLGHGIAPFARQVIDWNDPSILQNGWYFSDTLTINSPDEAAEFIGRVAASRRDGSTHGVMEVWEHLAGTAATPRHWLRQFHHHAGSMPEFSAWDSMDLPLGRGLWVEFTPTATNVSITKMSAKYMRIGNTVAVKQLISLNAAPTSTAFLGAPVPVDTTGWGVSTTQRIGTAMGWKSIGGAVYEGWVCLSGGNNVQIAGPGAIGWEGAYPVGWAASDRWSLDYTYECLP